VIGMSAGLVGTAMSNGLIAVRQKIDPAFEPQNALPNVQLNAACEPPTPFSTLYSSPTNLSNASWIAEYSCSRLAIWRNDNPLFKAALLALSSRVLARKAE